jgi:membrane-bound lytic murein transglycosylase D
MKTWLAWLLLSFPLLGAAASAPAIPEPPELEPDIRFWMRVYSEVTTNEGFIHDQRNLAVVYETLHFEPNLPPRERERLVTASRERYQAILHHLGTGAAPQDATEQRVRELWAGADPARLLAAADDVRFQLGQADRFRAGLRRSGAWEPHIAQTLAALGLPPELAALPHVESSFQPLASSKAGAAGMWQFIRSTGRRYLRIDSSVDERLDPYRSTEAAAQLLNYNYLLLGSWPLAITAYNHGAEGMRRAREQVGTDDIVQIVRHYQSRTFGFASRNYYVSFLAALRLERDPEKYFGPLKRDEPVPTHELRLSAPARVDQLASVLQLERATLQELNPALRAAVWRSKQPVPRGYRLRVPDDLGPWTPESLAAKLAAPPGTKSSAPVLVAAVTPAKPAAPVATAPEAAAATLVAPRATARAVPPVQASLVPLPSLPIGGGPSTRGRSAAEVAAAAAAYEAMYVVRSGDSLATIAVNTGVEPARLMAMNGLRDGDHIYEGQRLELVADSAHAANDALLAAQAVAEDREETAQQRAASATAQPVLSGDEAQAEGPALLADNGGSASADPIDYSVDASDRVVVVAAETVGHYADWLDVPVAQLRALNGMHGHNNVQIGRHFKLSFARVSRAQFEQRRRDYHRQLQTEYFAAHRITGSESYVARRGDSLWTVTQRGAMPVWLLQQYNPDVDFAVLRPGTRIVLPRVEDAT